MDTCPWWLTSMPCGFFLPFRKQKATTCFDICKSPAAWQWDWLWSPYSYLQEWLTGQTSMVLYPFSKIKRLKRWMIWCGALIMWYSVHVLIQISRAEENIKKEQREKWQTGRELRPQKHTRVLLFNIPHIPLQPIDFQSILKRSKLASQSSLGGNWSLSLILRRSLYVLLYYL